MNGLKICKWVFAAAVLIIASPSTAQGPSRTVKNGVEMIVLPYGTVQIKSIWERTTIEVCWENPGPLDNSKRAMVREAVEDTWVRHSILRFTGWGSCNNVSKGIRIDVRDDAIGPHTAALGSFIDARPGGMVLNFSFQFWSPSCKDTIDFCIKAVAVHEFGHAIGFAHEQNRKDAPAYCQKDAQGEDGDWNVTEYDPYSIMNYCNKHWLGDGKLSPRDIDAVNRVYKNQ